MDPDYARRYRELHERHWWWRAREEFVIEAIARVRSGKGQGAILDIGCGDGLLFDRLSQFGHVEGIEPDGAVVDVDGPWARQIRIQPFETFHPEHQYALVTLLDVLEHVSQPADFLGRAVGMLEPQGTAVVTVPAFRALWTSHDELNQHLTRFTRRGLEDLARRAGARVVRTAYFFHWVAMLKLMARGKERVAPSRPRAPKIPPALLNAGLRTLSRVEQKTLSRVGLPFGSSLLAVLERADSSFAVPDSREVHRS